MKSPTRAARKRVWLTAILLPLLWLVAGFEALGGAKQGESEFSQVLELVGSQYLGASDQEALITRERAKAALRRSNSDEHGAIVKFLKAFDDPDLRLLSPQQVAAFSADLDRVGSGLVSFAIERTGPSGEAVIVTPLVDSPAARAGLLPGDVLETVNGASTIGMDHEDVMRALRSTDDKPVVLTIRRDGRVFPTTLRPSPLRLKPVESQLRSERGKHVGYLRISLFSAETSRDLRASISEMEAAGVDGFLLDLRFNPGGLVPAAVDVAGLFLGRRLIVSFSGDGHVRQIRAETEPMTRKPMVVLVNRGTASAAEVVAAALQDYGRATVVGTHTRGRARALSMNQLGDGYAVLMPVATLFSPKNRDLNREGVTPDRIIEEGTDYDKLLSEALLATSGDTQFQDALSLAVKRR